MNQVTELVVDEGKVRKSVQGGFPLTITSYTLPHEMEIYISKMLAVFLKCAGHDSLKDYLEYCVLELAVNAKKANTKRVYFLEKKLDLNNANQYKDGMQNFKKDTFENLEFYLQKQKEKGFYVKIIFFYGKDFILIEVRNNVVISKMELMRIHDKLARSRRYNSLEDAFGQVMDSSEGAGLGLVVLILMLRKMGLDEDCFEIKASALETIATLRIPLQQTGANNVAGLTHAIADQVNSLPHFPANIIAVQRICSDPKSEMTDIAKHISTDPTLTADILRLVNSAQYMLANKVDSIAEAVKILGIKGIKNLLYSYGTQKILGEESKEKKELWEHCYMTAFFAYNLIKNFGKDKSILDDAYVAGMLHDMGKIVFFSGIPDFNKKMTSFCSEKGIPAIVLEDMSAGMNHAEVGALIAEKWNFPEELVAAIRFHHDPLSAPGKQRPLVDAVYVSDMFCEILRGRVIYEQLEPTVLLNFGLASKKHVEAVARKFFDSFKHEVSAKR